MSKRVLILAIGCSLHPWGKMFQTSRETWDAKDVDGVQTVFYFGNPVQPDTLNAIYFPIREDYYTMGHKLLRAFEWALKNREFDYIARVNSSCFVDKKELIKHVQTLPDENVFAGSIVAASETNPAWIWGGGQFVISRDVVQKIVDNQHTWDHAIMEDVAISRCVAGLGIPFTNGPSCTIDQQLKGWRYICYNHPGGAFLCRDLQLVPDNFFYRVKQDLNRDRDEFIMRGLHKLIG